ncbi:glutaminase A [Kitasatospora indigofera]|uniref:glutaminase A n=1 Tax=Kitasatospora indigofera TaxID=67307 RepID=UPI00368DBA82
MAAGPDVVTEALADIHRRLGALDEGEPAAYIPELARARREGFGLALVSMDGHRYQAGDAAEPFTLQSVSKPFVYALALAELGLDEVGRWVGAEPSGEAFNAISLEQGTGRPSNAMINAGAIATTALVPGATPAERFERILAGLSAFAGRRLDVDAAVHASEAATGDRNRALAYLMRGAGSLACDPLAATDLYFRQCAVRATAADLAVMAATLGNGGVNPVTGERVVGERVAVQVLSVMATCGMYDASGEWLLRVGLPAKSGVSGGLIAVSPARFGAACWSPPLDRAGNPVRGTAALRELSERFGLHLMLSPAPAAPTVVAGPSAGTAPRRGAFAVVAVQGALDFTAAERVLFELETGTAGPVLLDLGRVTRLDTVARVMITATLARLAAGGRRVAVAGEVLPPSPDAPWERLGPGGAGSEGAGPDRAGSDGAGADPAGPDSAGPDTARPDTAR